MDPAKNPLDIARAVMIETVERSRSVSQAYIDLFERTMKGLPNAHHEQIATFKNYLERQVTDNHAFVDRLLRARDLQEAFGIQTEYFQAQLKNATDNAGQFSSKFTEQLNRPMHS